jgi:RNA polymerase sigma-70 factor, ECF subfamily
MQQSTLNELVVLSRQNDARAFRQLVEAHQAMVFTLAFRLLCNDDDARDIVQETFIRVWKNLNRFNTSMKFTTWLYTIATNLCYDKLKSEKRNTTIRLTDQNVLNGFISDENMEKTILNAELAQIITSLTNELTPKQKLVFTLSDLEGLETDEITAITGLSAAKIKSNLFLARQFLRKRLENL